MSVNTATFPCPRCRRQTPKMDSGLYYCSWCRALFDDNPDEGGTHSNDPTRRIEQVEEWKRKQHITQRKPR